MTCEMLKCQTHTLVVLKVIFVFIICNNFHIQHDKQMALPNKKLNIIKKCYSNTKTLKMQDIPLHLLHTTENCTGAETRQNTFAFTVMLLFITVTHGDLQSCKQPNRHSVIIHLTWIGGVTQPAEEVQCPLFSFGGSKKQETRVWFSVHWRCWLGDIQPVPKALFWSN